MSPGGAGGPRVRGISSRVQSLAHSLMGLKNRSHWPFPHRCDSCHSHPQFFPRWTHRAKIPAESFTVRITLWRRTWAASPYLPVISWLPDQEVRRSEWILSGLKLWCQLSQAPQLLGQVGHAGQPYRTPLDSGLFQTHSPSPLLGIH